MNFLSKIALDSVSLNIGFRGDCSDKIGGKKRLIMKFTF